jgi:cytochrome c oxidase assembly protein subunit 15
MGRVIFRLVTLVRWLIACVWRPTPSALRGWALSSVIANAVIISTGAAVRLSSSGLGCPDWPKCTQASAVAAHSAGQTTLNTWIEFGNRLLNFPLVAIAGLTFIAFLRYYQCHGKARKDLVWLAAVLPLGVVAQAVVGGIVVLTRLNPALVAAHFLLSAGIILTSAVVLHARAAALAALDGLAALDAGAAARVPARADVRVLAGLLAGVTALMLAAGTVVTGTGPLAGTTIDQHGHRTTVPRFHFSLDSVTQLHADIGWFIAALAVALVIGLRFAGASRRTVRLGWIVLCGLGVQGIIGYAQYFNQLPAGLVWVHVSTSVVLWIFVLRLWLSTGTGLPRPTAAGGASVGGTAAGGTAVDGDRRKESADGTAPVKTTLLSQRSAPLEAGMPGISGFQGGQQGLSGELPVADGSIEGVQVLVAQLTAGAERSAVVFRVAQRDSAISECCRHRGAPDGRGLLRLTPRNGRPQERARVPAAGGGKPGVGRVRVWSLDQVHDLAVRELVLHRLAHAVDQHSHGAACRRR